MKVRCNKLSPVDKKSNDPWITEDNDYLVLSIYSDERRMFLYRMIGDDGITPALYDSQLFTTMSAKIPKNWIVDLNDGIFELSPKSWLTPGFWERFFDGDKEAREIFNIEYAEISACELASPRSERS